MRLRDLDGKEYLDFFGGILTVSVGVASTARRRFDHYGEAVEVATEMKQVAKRDAGSSFAVDRRTT